MLSEDKGKFKLGKADAARRREAAIDEMVAQLKTDTKNVWVEIEGHTDNVGDEGRTSSSVSRAPKR